MFECDSKDLINLRSQFATANPSSSWNYKRRSLPYLFTENGVAMLSSVLNSTEAVQVNISIMRMFTKLRSFLLFENQLNDRIDKLEANTNRVFKIVFEKFDDIENQLTPYHPRNRKKIGIKQ
jgi:hypothetical protein